MRSKVAEELADEGDTAGATIAQARNKFLTQVVKKNMIENIIPIIIELKHLLEKQHSPLLRDLMSCLKEVMKDYRTEVQDVLSADRQLANEIEFDLKRFEEQQKELEDQRRKQFTPGNSTQVSARSSQAAGSTPAVQPEVFVTPQLWGATPSPKNGSNVTPLAGAVNKMQIGRRHTLAADGQTMVPITNALTSKVRVIISPLQDKIRHTFVAPAIMRSARKAVDHAQKVTEQLRRSSSVPQVEVAKEDIAVTKGQQTRTPLKPVNPKVSQKQNEDRAASTPAGERSHLLRVSFFETNPSTAVPPSPIPTSLPIRVYAGDKVTPPSWIESSDTEGNVGSEVEGKEQIICMMSPEQN